MKKIIKVILPLFLIVILLSNNTSKKIVINRNNYKGQRVLNAVDYLIEKANMETVTNYDDGVNREMYTFNHSEKDNINELVDYRYIGNDPNNYVYFNCSDSLNEETCELWRIIGIFVTEDENGIKEYRVKIMRNDPIENSNWDESYWLDSSIYKYLNDEAYWQSLKGKYQDMIDQVKFNVGKNNGLNISGNSLYFKEKEEKEIGKVGLLLPSDVSYTYAYGINNNCYNNIGNCNDVENSWMNINSILTITKDTIGSQDSLIYPVVYLKPSIGIESGNGSDGDAYVLRVLKKSNYQSEAEMDIDEDDIKKEVYVDDTASSVSKIIFTISGLIIGIGLVIIVINYIKSKKEIK